MPPPLWAAIVLAIYLVPFFLLGWIVKKMCDRWMSSRGLENAPGDPGGGRRRRFLLGAWLED